MRCNPNCDLCLGSGVIRLPVRRLIVMYKDKAQLPRSYNNSTREFPCPECEGLVTDDRVTVLTAQTVESVALFDTKYDVIPAIHKGLAMELAIEMLKHDAIAFQQRPQEFAASMVFRATIGLVSKDRVSSMASRARVAGSDMARRLARLIQKRVSGWNDQYNISKTDACYIADFCLKEILATENQQQ